jgi:hypothetical protein
VATAPGAGPRDELNHPLISAWAEQAADALAAAQAHRVEREMESSPRRPGLYAVHASTAVWRELGLGEPSDLRPLYIGKSESSLAGRDVGVHFGLTAIGRATSVTGGSTLRRSLAALLHDSQGFRGVPRNPAKPGHYSNYGLLPEHDVALSSWMRERLLLACWPKPVVEFEVPLAALEQEIFGRLRPPLNLAAVTTPWKATVDAARRVMAAEARAWSRVG